MAKYPTWKYWLSSVKSHQDFSKFWFTADLEMGLHHFQYSVDNFECLPHTHGEYIITVCLNRDFDYHIRGQCEHMTAGDLVVTNPGELHNGRYRPADSPSEGLSLFLTQRTLEKVLKDIHISFDPAKDHVLLPGKVQDRKVPQLVQEVYRELQEKQRGYEIIVRSCIHQILVYLFRNCLEPTIATTQTPLPLQLPWWQMNRTIEYMNTRGKSNFRISELCAEIGTSPSRFIRLFKNSTNMKAPHTYFNALLIDKAQKLLRSGDYSIKEVSYHLGFQNVSHFCTVFRSVSGMTPNSYRFLEAQKVV